MKRKPLRRTGGFRRRPGQEGFWRAVTNDGEGPCAMRHEGAYAPECDGPMEAHHYLPKRMLDDDQAQDPRNGVALCRRHHDLVERAVLYAPRPPQYVQFLLQWGLSGLSARVHSRRPGVDSDQ